MSQKPRDLRERTFLFACDIVRFCSQLGKDPGAPRQISWQLLDSGTSIGANTEEAKGAYSRRDFAAKNSIVLKEARESRLWLRVILEEHLAPAAEVLPLLDEANQLVAIFTASNKRLKLGAIVRAPFVGVLILFAGPISAF